MKMIFKTTLILAFSLGFFILIVSISIAQECTIAVVEEQQPGDNDMADNAADELEQYGNNNVIRAKNLGDMETKVSEKMSEVGCDCIKNLWIVGHGRPGGIAVGNGQKGTDPFGEISLESKPIWSSPLGNLSPLKLCKDAAVILMGCNVGHCQKGQGLTYSLSKYMGAKVVAAVDKPYTVSRLVAFLLGESPSGMINYLKNKPLQIAYPTSESEPGHKQASDYDEAPERETLSGKGLYCACNGILYPNIQGCADDCEATMSCYSGICDPKYFNYTCCEYSSNPILTGGASANKALTLRGKNSSLLNIRSNLGSLIGRPAGKTIPKTFSEAVAGWDEDRINTPTVLKDGSIYRMWYTGFDSYNTGRIGYATSNDGTTWIKYAGNPIIEEGASGSWVYNPTVIKDGSTFKMWYAEYPADAKYARIRYATSSDGINWTKHPSYVLDVGPPSTWDENGVSECCVIKDGSLYKMWYGGCDSSLWWRTGYATSTDGIVWTKYSGNPVLSEGKPGTWDEWAASAPEVIKDGSTYHMLYGGVDSHYIGRIGYARSSDGIAWTKAYSNPLIMEGLGSAWDNGSAFHPTFFKDANENIFKIFYRGYCTDTGNYAFGFSATTNLAGKPIFYVALDGNCGGKSPCYNSIQNAVNAAENGSQIWISGETYTKAVVLNTSKTLKLLGSWNSDFSAQTVTTRLTQAPKALQGTLILQMLTVKP